MFPQTTVFETSSLFLQQCPFDGFKNRLHNGFISQPVYKTLILLGCARISKKEDQDIAAQVDALNKAGCERIFYEKASGGRWDRPELHSLLDQLRPDDIFLVWKLDRLSRSLKDLIAILESIEHDMREQSFRA